MDSFFALTEKLRSNCPSLEVREREIMIDHTSFRVGGPVRLMALPKTRAEAYAAVCAASALGIVPFLMGNGTNLLVADVGAEAFVIKCVGGLDATSLIDGAVIRAESGVSLIRLVGFAMNSGLAGLEFAFGIPGTLGGAVTMNAGAYGGEMCQVVVRTEYLNADGTLGVCTGAAHEFDYRHSAFSDGTRLILSTELMLQPDDRGKIRARMDDFMAKRKSNQPLEYPSAGSIFKRPEGYFAAALIEECGLKGRRVGGVQVSEKHAGFLINRGGATCRDILRLMAQVQEVVLQRRGIVLEPEIRILGCV